MAAIIQFKRGLAASWTSVNPTLAVGECGFESDTKKLKIGTGSTAWTSLPYFSGDISGSNLNDLGDVTITSAANGDFLRWNGSAWINDAVNLSTDTVGSYVESLVAGTGISVANNSGEGATPTVSLNASLDNLTDAVITSPLEYESLVYNGTNWVNQYASNATYVRNAEATTLTTGTVVYLFGATGDHATVKRADNDSYATSLKTVGIVASPIASSANGPVVTRGYVDGIDLSTGYASGDILWLAGDGGFTKVKPTAPEHLVFVGVVVRATLNGIVYVATQNGYQLDELRDVKINGVTDGQFLRYDSASTLWINDTINLGTDTAGNYVNDVTAGTGVTVTHTPGEGSSPTIAIGQSVATSASPTFAGLTLSGDLTVNGTTTTINSTTLTVDDKNIELGSVTTPTDVTADGGGITLKGTTDKTLNWVDATDAWTSSENMNLLAGKVYEIDGTSVLSSTTLGSGITSSSLTSLGTIATGVWNGTLIGPTYGGTGVNNGSSTITLGGNFTTSGAYTTSLTATANTAITLPTTGTLATLAGTETFTNKTFTSPVTNSPTLTLSTSSSTTDARLSWDSTNKKLQVGNGTISLDFASSNVITNAQGASYTLVLADKDKLVEISNGSANTLTVPLNSSVAFPIGTQITILQTGAGATTITATGGVTINATPGLILRAQWSSVTLIKRAENTWVALGDLRA